MTDATLPAYTLSNPSYDWITILAWVVSVIFCLAFWWCVISLL